MVGPVSPCCIILSITLAISQAHRAIGIDAFFHDHDIRHQPWRSEMGWEWGGMWGGNMGNSWKPWTQVRQVAQRYWWSEFRTKWRCPGADSTTFKSQECQVRQ